MVATGTAGQPVRALPLGARAGVVRGKYIKPTGRQIELFSGCNGRQLALSECVQNMTDKGWGMAVGELLMLFKGPQDRPCGWLHHQSFRRASLRSPSSKTGGAAMQIPVLKTTRTLLFCSPRDSMVYTWLPMNIE